MRTAVAILMFAAIVSVFTGMAPILALGLIPVVLVYMAIRAVKDKDQTWLYRGIFAIVAIILVSALFGGFFGPLLACVVIAAGCFWLATGNDVKPLFPTGTGSGDSRENDDV